MAQLVILQVLGLPEDIPTQLTHEGLLHLLWLGWFLLVPLLVVPQQVEPAVDLAALVAGKLLLGFIVMELVPRQAVYTNILLTIWTFDHYNYPPLQFVQDVNVLFWGDHTWLLILQEIFRLLVSENCHTLPSLVFVFILILLISVIVIFITFSLGIGLFICLARGGCLPTNKQRHIPTLQDPSSHGKPVPSLSRILLTLIHITFLVTERRQLIDPFRLTSRS